MNDNKCLFCTSEVDQASHTSGAHDDVYDVPCPICGPYTISRQARITMGREIENTARPKRTRTNISGWLRRNSGFKFSLENTEHMCHLPTPSFHERADSFLQFLNKKTDYAGHRIGADRDFLIRGWCLNHAERDEILRYMETENWIEQLDPSHDGAVRDFKIAPAGWRRLEKLMTPVLGNQCFIAMWFDKKLEQVYWQAIAAGIKDAGYIPHRVDQRQHNDRIDDEIMAQIRRSRFILADFTGHRGGVYYEAGFAKALGLEVIWTCRKDHFKKLHFDIRQFNCIAWTDDDLPSFRKQINWRIESVFGRGPIASASPGT